MAFIRFGFDLRLGGLGVVGFDNIYCQDPNKAPLGGDDAANQANELNKLLRLKGPQQLSVQALRPQQLGAPRHKQPTKSSKMRQRLRPVRFTFVSQRPMD
ncbi:unnamed protein product [Durusdinium trenchii]|uniref:Uncharacterized protein n=1 Tax=Durusdinium trenchii TaxID=1381693 RepID=A0ABP0JHE4_9DINO